jgi:hypothetical protein
VKVNFVRGVDAAAIIKAGIDYIMHRLNRDGEEVSRTLFGYDGPLEKWQVFQMIDAAGEDITFFRIMISPDPKKEDLEKILDLWTVTQQTILRFEERLGRQLQFIATEHTDQTEIRHVHSIVLISGRLNVADLRALRQAATGAALSRQPERQQEQGQQVERQSVPARHAEVDTSARVGKPARDFTCPACEIGHMVKLGSGVYRCPECSLVLGRGQGRERRSWQLQL